MTHNIEQTARSCVEEIANDFPYAHYNRSFFIESLVSIVARHLAAYAKNLNNRITELSTKVANEHRLYVTACDNRTRWMDKCSDLKKQLALTNFSPPRAKDLEDENRVLKEKLGRPSSKRRTFMNSLEHAKALIDELYELKTMACLSVNDGRKAYEICQKHMEAFAKEANKKLIDEHEKEIREFQDAIRHKVIELSGALGEAIDKAALAKEVESDQPKPTTVPDPQKVTR